MKKTVYVLFLIFILHFLPPLNVVEHMFRIYFHPKFQLHALTV